MKKLLSLVMVLVLSLALAACSDATTGNPDSASDTDASTAGSSDTPSDTGSQADAQAPETITIKSLNASQKEADLEVPYDPQRIAILDMASLDILSMQWESATVLSAQRRPRSAICRATSMKISPNLGTIKEADLEAVMLT